MREQPRTTPAQLRLAGALFGDAPPERFEDGHRPRVLAGIASGRLPLKFAYAGSGADAHDAYASTDNYGAMMAGAREEAAALARSGACAGRAPAVVEVGPGNGWHTIHLLRELRRHDLAAGHYLGLDFSARLLEISSERVRQELPAVTTGVWDMEGAPSDVVERWRPPGPVLACLVGHTLGNFEDPAQAMRNLAGLLRPADVLLASVLLRPMPVVARRSIDAYRTEKFRLAALEPMLAAGMNASDLEFTVDYRDGAFIGEVILPYGADLDGMNLPPGYRVRCFMSRRFECDEVLRIIGSAGFGIQSSAIDPKSDHMTVVASRAKGLP